MNNLVKYNDGEIELTISLKKETIWLSQLQISEIFGTSSDNISLHLKNIYNEKELDEKSTTEDFSVVRQEGNLDTVISVGYRVSSYKATKFRQWATSVLKEYISNVYHLGATLKDLGNKVFAFSKMDINSLDIIKKLEDCK